MKRWMPVFIWLRAEGVDERLGGVNRLTSIADAVDSYLQRKDAS